VETREAKFNKFKVSRELPGLRSFNAAGGWIGLTREETKGTSQMRGSLREMRIRLLVPLHGQFVMGNRKRVRSETPAGKATTVGLSGSVMERGRPLVDHSFSTTGRTTDRKGRTGKEARRG
jgi:hypothetical protein